MKKPKTKKPRAKMYGNNIRAILREKGMSPQELADITGLAPSHISIIINGARRCISLPIAFAISEALDSKIEDVFLYKKPTIKADVEDDAN